MNFVDDAMKSAVDEINKARAREPLAAQPITGEVQPFVQLSQKLADSVVEAYEQQLTEIQNKLEEAKVVADQIREATLRRADDLSDFRRRVESFSKTLVEAFDLFQRSRP